MLKFTTIKDKQILADYLRQNLDLNTYHLGDLDAFFWPHTQWHAAMQGGEIAAIVLLYTAPDPIVMLAILNENEPEMRALLTHLLPDLPAEVYAHLSPGLDDLFEDKYRTSHNGEHYKMTLTNTTDLSKYAAPLAVVLDTSDLPRIERLYARAYPGNWFDNRMLQTGQYLGLADEDGELTCIAGIHVYSPEYRVAALGNITTDPARRGRGLATGLTAALCQHLLKTVDVIGLNVRTDNAAAIAAYSKIGFEVSGVYHEWEMTKR
ncbi:MAG TPA: GNAT family N-acetyltransferase [Anaerolineales bacterium]|nr:GNAT family N-acetyltransferase [Anaerolineales bacterium]